MDAMPQKMWMQSWLAYCHRVVLVNRAAKGLLPLQLLDVSTMNTKKHFGEEEERGDWDTSIIDTYPTFLGWMFIQRIPQSEVGLHRSLQM
jgi:hypothetical protein